MGSGSRSMAPSPDGADLRDLPSVDRVAQVAATQCEMPDDLLVSAARAEIAAARDGIGRGSGAPSLEALAAAAAERAALLVRDAPRPVINATGVIIHTNLGRAPLSDRALAAVQAAAAGYAALEMDLDTGRRGGRGAAVAASLREITGAEAAIVLNNNAGATFLALEALAAGGEVLVSRGEAIEIGGGFRVPDILAASGAVLRDVGTTNRTRLEDYADALSDRTAAILHVHRSNFAQIGFTESPDLAALAQLAHEHAVPLISDLGSGTLLDPTRFGLANEPRVQDALNAGCDVVTFSGDKLLGGPQVGIAAGNADSVERIARRPLARALRCDALTLAALQATLAHYLLGEAETSIPVWQMIAAQPEGLRARARRLARGVAGASVAASEAAVGGGALPGQVLSSFAIRLAGDGQALAERLRRAEPPVIARVRDGDAWLDMRTVLPRDERPLRRALLDLSR